MSAALATQSSTREVVTLGAIDDLITWAITAPIEELTWRLSEIGDIREWTRAQQAATDLRIRAVRLEMISLRRVAQAGLTKKIPTGGNLYQSVAKWLAALTDDEFDAALNDLDGERTPIALYRADKAQRDAMSEALRDRTQSDWKRRTSWTRDQGQGERLRSAANTLLDEIVAHGEPFTVASAADVLADRLGIDPVVRAETAEGLRAMVRSAIHTGDRMRQRQGDHDLPGILTVQDHDGTYSRVPIEAATIGHLVAHEREVRDHAMDSLRKADALLEAIDSLVSRVTNLKSMSLADLVEQDDDERDAVMGVKVGPLVMRRSAPLDAPEVTP